VFPPDADLLCITENGQKVKQNVPRNDRQAVPVSTTGFESANYGSRPHHAKRTNARLSGAMFDVPC